MSGNLRCLLLIAAILITVLFERALPCGHQCLAVGTGPLYGKLHFAGQKCNKVASFNFKRKTVEDIIIKEEVYSGIIL